MSPDIVVPITLACFGLGMFGLGFLVGKAPAETKTYHEDLKP